MANRELLHIEEAVWKWSDEAAFAALNICPPNRAAPKSSEQFRDILEGAYKSFLSNDYKDAEAKYSSVVNATGASAATVAFASFGLASSKLCLEQWEEAHSILAPLDHGSFLFGLPLWNVAVALYRMGHAEKSLAIIEKWLSRKPPKQHAWRGYAAAIALTAYATDKDSFDRYIFSAKQSGVWDQVATELGRWFAGRVLDQPSAPPSVSTSAVSLNANQTAELSRLVTPRKPTKSTALAAQLNATQLTHFDVFVELLSESSFDEAISSIRALREERAELIELQAAEAIACLFAGQAQHAKEKLSELTLRQGGNGNTWWNLAAACVSLSDWNGASAALSQCLKTEYKTSPSVAKALKLLKPLTVRERDEPKVRAPGRGPAKLALEICQPKKLKRSYFPDRLRYRTDERESIQRAIESTRDLDAAAATTVLRSHLEKFPESFAIYAHLTSNLLLSRHQTSVSEARQLLDTAFRLPGGTRPGPEVLMNYSYCCAMQEDFEGIVNVVAPIARDHTESHQLAAVVALAQQEAGFQSAASQFAGMALRYASKADVNRYSELFAKAEIKPSHAGNVLGADTPGKAFTEAVRRARSELEGGRREDAISILESIWCEDLIDLPEVPLSVFEPKLEVIVSSTQDRRIEDALSLFIKGETLASAAEYHDLFVETGRIRFATNAIAALVKAEEFDAASRVLSVGVLKRPKYVLARYNVALAKIGLAQHAAAFKLLRLPVKLEGWLLNLANDFSRLIIAGARRDRAPRKFAPEVRTAIDRLSHTHDLSLGLRCLNAWSALCTLAVSDDEVLSELRKIETVSTQVSMDGPRAVSSLAEFNQVVENYRKKGADGQLVEFCSRVAETGRATGAYPLVFAAYARLANILISEGKQADAIALMGAIELALMEVDQRTPEIGLKLIHYLNSFKIALEVGAVGLAERLLRSLETFDPHHKNVLENGETFRLRIVPQLPAMKEKADAVANALEALVQKAPVDAPKFLGEAQVSRDLSGWMTVNDQLGRLLRALPNSDDFLDALDELRIGLRHVCPEGLMDKGLAAVAQLDIRNPSRNLELILDVALYGDTLWAIEHEGLARGTLFVKTNQALPRLILTDGTTNEVLFDGSIGKGQELSLRWTTSIGMEASEAEGVEVPLLASLGAGEQISQLVVSAKLIDREPRVVQLQAGALQPGDMEELYGVSNELFGREAVLKKIIGNLGESRSSKTFYLEGLRQMGKTSILRFVESRSPPHVLSVYVNLELSSGASQRDASFWAFVARQIRRALRDRVLHAGSPDQPLPATYDDFLEFLHERLAENGYKYAHLLFDEFRYVLKVTSDPVSLLNELRNALQDGRVARLAFTVADRRSMAELQDEFDHDIWAHMQTEAVGPLNEEAVARALLLQNSELVFSKSAVRALHSLAGGYPYHFVKAVGLIANRLTLEGPWLLALDSDVELVEPEILAEDRMFSEGICPKSRVTDDVFAVFSCLLRSWDLRDDAICARHGAIGIGGAELETITSFSTYLDDNSFLPGSIADVAVSKMVAYGMLRRRDSLTEFFSPLFRKWLQRLRAEGKDPAEPQKRRDWYQSHLASRPVSSDAWRDLDLAFDAAFSHTVETRPLSGVAPHAASMWSALAAPIETRRQFKEFIDAVHSIFVNGRAQYHALKFYPYLFLVVHEIASLKRYFDKAADADPFAQRVWQRTVERTINRRSIALDQINPAEWKRIQDGVQAELSSALRHTTDVGMKSRWATLN